LNTRGFIFAVALCLLPTPFFNHSLKRATAATATKMDLISTANQGFSFLCLERYDEAALSFRMALQKVCASVLNEEASHGGGGGGGGAEFGNVRFYASQKDPGQRMRAFEPSSNSNSNSNSNSSNRGNSNRGNSNPCRSASPSDHQRFTERDEETASPRFSDHNTLYLHTRAFAFCRNTAGEPKHAEQHAHTLAAALLFNLALAHHLQFFAMLTETTTSLSRDKHLETSLQYYELALEAAHQGHPPNAPRMVPATRRTLLAIHNNLCHAHYSLFELAGVRQNFQALDRVLALCTGPELESHHEIRMNLVYHYPQSSNGGGSHHVSEPLIRTAPAA